MSRTVDGLFLFSRPVPVAAVLLMIVNDHYLKAYFHNGLTGKLSDFCGVFFLPLFIGALFTLFTGKKYGVRLLAAFIFMTDLVFVAVKFSTVVQNGYLNFQAAIGLPAIVTPDPSDLWALLANALTWFYIYKSRYSSTMMEQV